MALTGPFTQQEPAGFAPTYSPATADLASARPIRVGVAQDVTGITILHVAQPDHEGRFTVDGLPPDTYLAVALQSITGTEWQDPEFLEKLRFDATPVTVGDGDQKTVQLTLR